MCGLSLREAVSYHSGIRSSKTFTEGVCVVDAKIVLLPGDGIGPEVVAEGQKVLNAVAARFGHRFTMTSHPIGGIAIDEFGTALPDATLAAAKDSHAILLGAVGGPKWDNPTAKVRPEQGLLKIRKELGLFANLRPISVLPELVAASPLKRRRALLAAE